MEEYRELIEVIARKGKLSILNQSYCLGYLDAKKNMMNDTEYYEILDLINRKGE